MDLSEFQPQDTPWHVCMVSHVVEKLSDEQRATLAEAFLSTSVTATRIAEVLTKWTGINVPVAGVRRHRRKECKCND